MIPRLSSPFSIYFSSSSHYSNLFYIPHLFSSPSSSSSSSSTSLSSFSSSLNILTSRKYFSSSLSSPYTQYSSYFSSPSSYSFLYFPTAIYPSVSHSPTFGVFSLHKYLLRVLLSFNLHKNKIPDSCEMTRNNGLPVASEM